MVWFVKQTNSNNFKTSMKFIGSMYDAVLLSAISPTHMLWSTGESQQPSNEASDGSHSSDGSHDLLRSPSSQASSQASQPLSQFKGSRMSNNLRVHAFITLGKCWKHLAVITHVSLAYIILCSNWFSIEALLSLCC